MIPLKHNLELNGWKERTIIIDKALWHKKDRLTFYETDKGVVGHFVNIPENEYMVDCVTLDDYNLKKLDWMKIDVEGAELAVLIGGKATIRRLKPKMIIEVHEGIVKHIIPDFKAEDIIKWLPPYSLKEIEGYENGRRFLLVPRTVVSDELKNEMNSYLQV